ncbi:PH domain-containing protein [Solibacillus sp. FSL K6-1523]|uniref:PH domain-containing protein n=1 Tax=Solibacillus sp. FSL K6-1523 TaxID=2921471 RepID=UPI0030FCDB11
MRLQPKYQLPKKSQTVWRLYGIIQTVILALIAAGVLFFADKYEWPQWIIWITISIVVLSIILSIIIFPNVRWKIWRYEVREQEIEIQSGLFVVKRTLIPMVRVQHVDTEQGPILKKYNLANISISSAATVHTIPMLLTEDADMLRTKISELARVAEEDV